MKYLDLKTYGINKVSFYLALEQYRLPKIEEDEFFLWDIPPSIVIGRNQLIDGEVNVPYTKKNNIDIFRRPSGGGAIFADEGCFMYTFLTKEKNKNLVYEQCLKKLLNVLKDLGLDVYFSGRNDLMFLNKKFSGTAFLQTKDGSVMHGTFLFDTNITHLVEALTVDNEKIISKGIKSVSERVINLKPYLKFDKHELMEHLGNSIGDEKSYLSKDEFLEVKEIEKKYLSKEWVYGNNPKFSFKNRKRFQFGLLEVFLLVKRNKVKEMNLKGDFFQSQDLFSFLSYFKGIPYERKAFEDVLNEHPMNQFIENSENKNLIELIFKGGEE